MSSYAEIQITLLSSDGGGRQSPIWIGEDAPNTYRPHLRIKGGKGEYLGVEFVDGPDGPMEPGGSAVATVRFTYEPQVNYDALVVGAEFDIMEGGKVVGTGRVTNLSYCDGGTQSP